MLIHGHTSNKKISAEFRSWTCMRGRCLDPKNPGYHRYGAAGISICERWRESFSNFYTDMGPKPTRQHTLDRIDPHGNYEPANCRWATAKQQANNRRDNTTLELDGETRTIAQWAAVTGIADGTLRNRVARGWDARRTLTTPAGPRVYAPAHNFADDEIHDAPPPLGTIACKYSEWADGRAWRLVQGVHYGSYESLRVNAHQYARSHGLKSSVCKLGDSQCAIHFRPCGERKSSVSGFNGIAWEVV